MVGACFVNNFVSFSPYLVFITYYRKIHFPQARVPDQLVNEMMSYNASDVNESHANFW